MDKNYINVEDDRELNLFVSHRKPTSLKIGELLSISIENNFLKITKHHGTCLCVKRPMPEIQTAKTFNFDTGNPENFAIIVG